ncbi:hypothetical protein D3872_15490 [Massilia cavernae]|uniref:Lipoprotein n=1 Tax=Massilia cavernae TaxID=2320864 RepID=A0A418XRB0_9BURK|nr:hypothetical protein D3872_15490 [Massilia cavernae]
MRSASLAAFAALAACSGGNDEAANRESVLLSSAPAAGSSAFLVSGDPAGSFGEAFIGSDGNGIMLIENDDLRPAAAYYEVTGNAARRVPAADAALQTSLVAGSATPVNVKPITLAELAGSYAAINRDNAVTNFTLSAEGVISAGASSCRVNGNIRSASTIAGALPLIITLSGCGADDGDYRGYAVKAGEYAPAALRMVGVNRASFIDMLAFR